MGDSRGQPDRRGDPGPRADGDNGPELLAARLRLADAWRGEMVHAYRTLRELLPDDRAGALMEAQYGFEAYLPGAVEVYAAVYGVGFVLLIWYMIRILERDELLEELVRYYVQTHEVD